MSNSPSSHAPHDSLVIDINTLGAKGVSAVRTAYGILGTLGVITGVLLLVWPGHALMAVAAIAAIFFLIGGIARTAFGIFGSGITGGARALHLIFGLIVIFTGIVVLKNLDTATATLTLLVVILIGVGWIIEGVLTLATASRRESKGMAYASGVLGILAGVIVVAVPGWTALWLAVFTGATFVILGLTSLYRSFTFGKDAGVIDA